VGLRILTSQCVAPEAGAGEGALTAMPGAALPWCPFISSAALATALAFRMAVIALSLPEATILRGALKLDRLRTFSDIVGAAF